jgi:hypothetical protein
MLSRTRPKSAKVKLSKLDKLGNCRKDPKIIACRSWDAMPHKRDSIIPKGNHLDLRATQINPYSHLTPYHPFRLK